jgi:hypothetical protein
MTSGSCGALLLAFAASSCKLPPSTRLKWVDDVGSVFNGLRSLIASTSSPPISPPISPARGVTSTPPISTHHGDARYELLASNVDSAHVRELSFTSKEPRSGCFHRGAGPAVIEIARHRSHAFGNLGEVNSPFDA